MIVDLISKTETELDKWANFMTNCLFEWVDEHGYRKCGKTSVNNGKYSMRHWVTHNPDGTPFINPMTEKKNRGSTTHFSSAEEAVSCLFCHDKVSLVLNQESETC